MSATFYVASLKFLSQHLPGTTGGEHSTGPVHCAIRHGASLELLAEASPQLATALCVDGSDLYTA